MGNVATELASANFVMQAFKQRYLPQLEGDLGGKDVSAEDDDQVNMPWLVSSHINGWNVDSAEGTISYRPAAHVDRLLKYWIDALKPRA